MNNIQFFQNKVVIVTGASGGIGRVTASVPWISPKISPEKVVKTMIKGLKKNKANIIVPSIYFLLGSLNDISPRLVDWFYRILKIEGQRIENLE
jgi:short-subunit dehydrogenase